MAVNVGVDVGSSVDGARVGDGVGRRVVGTAVGAAVGTRVNRQSTSQQVEAQAVRISCWKVALVEMQHCAMSVDIRAVGVTGDTQWHRTV